jgi:hypothetical protein
MVQATQAEQIFKEYRFEGAPTYVGSVLLKMHTI